MIFLAVLGFFYEEWRLFHEYKIDGKDKENYGYKVVPLQRFAFEANRDNHTEYKARDNLLDYLELNQREWSSVDLGTDSVGGYKE